MRFFSRLFSPIARRANTLPHHSLDTMSYRAVIGLLPLRGHVAPVPPARSFFRIVRQNEVAVVETLGKFTGVKDPGFRIMIPFFQRMERVDMRTRVLEMPNHEVITRDNVSITVNATTFYTCINAKDATYKIEEPDRAIRELATGTLREVLSHSNVDEVLQKREEFSQNILERIQETAIRWGMDVSRVQINDIKFADTMVRAMAKKAEAVRSREAKVIHADAELQTATTLAKAAEQYAKDPNAMKLRELDTLYQVSKEPSNTIVAFPNEIFKSLPVPGMK